MTNAEWMIKNGYKFGGLSYVYEKSEEDGHWAWHLQHLEAGIDEILNGTYANTLTDWLDAEHKEPILDESERQYLSAVIKPFSGHIEYICKEVMKNRLKEFQFIKISTGNNYYDSIILPGFTPDTMYKGMELNRKYTVEELSL